jgi:hypothetical protein
MKSFNKQKLYESYSGALTKAWESYIKIIDLLLGLAGATALVFVASIKITDWASLPNRDFIIYVFVFSAMAIICGVFWRFASQYFMEYETLGSSHAAKNYFHKAGIVPVTTTHQARHFLQRFYRLCFRFFPIPMGIFLLCAWVSIFLVFFSDTTETKKLTETSVIKESVSTKDQSHKTHLKP